MENVSIDGFVCVRLTTKNRTKDKSQRLLFIQDLGEEINRDFEVAKQSELKF